MVILLGTDISLVHAHLHGHNFLCSYHIHTCTFHRAPNQRHILSSFIQGAHLTFRTPAHVLSACAAQCFSLFMHITDLAMCTCIKCLHTLHTNSHASCLATSHCTILVTCTCIALSTQHSISPFNCTLHILATLTCIKCSNMPHMLTFSYTKYTSHILATCTFNKLLHIAYNVSHNFSELQSVLPSTKPFSRFMHFILFQRGNYLSQIS